MRLECLFGCRRLHILLVQIQTFPEHLSFQKRIPSERDLYFEFQKAFYLGYYDRNTSHPVRHISFVERVNKLEIEDPRKFTEQTL